MTKKLLLKLSFFALIVVCFHSCKKDDSNGTPGGGPPPPLTVVLSKNQIYADGWEEVGFTVKDENNNDVTASSTIFVNGSSLSRPSYYTAVSGLYNIKASRSGKESPVVKLTAVDPGASPFSQKILVEDYTGTWCGHCPRLGIALDNYVNTGHPNCIVVANHGPTVGSDPFTFSGHAALANAIQLQGYPTAWVDRDFEWNESISTLNNQFINRRAPLGLSIATTINGNTINVSANVKFDVTTEADMKLVIYLVEDGQVRAQTNYGYYGLPNPISNYVHNGILRATATDLFGDMITKSSQVKGSIYTRDISFNASGYGITNCRIVAFVVLGNNVYNREGVLNVQTVKAGNVINFD